MFDAREEAFRYRTAAAFSAASAPARPTCQHPMMELGPLISFQHPKIQIGLPLVSFHQARTTTHRGQMELRYNPRTLTQLNLVINMLTEPSLVITHKQDRRFRHPCRSSLFCNTDVLLQLANTAAFLSSLSAIRAVVPFFFLETNRNCYTSLS